MFMLGDRDPEVETLQASLRSLGYGIETSGTYDGETMAVVAAFQRHWRPAKVDGIADVSTVATLRAVLAAREPRTNATPTASK
jgi:N-acetylmuramoyl-L-alanine amidase